MSNMMGKYIKQKRIHEGIAQKDFADMLELSSSRLADIESGRKNASISFAKRLAKKSRIPVTKLTKLALTDALRREKVKLKVIEY